jgi:hypothetical protein
MHHEQKSTVFLAPFNEPDDQAFLSPHVNEQELEAKELALKLLRMAGGMGRLTVNMEDLESVSSSTRPVRLSEASADLDHDRPVTAGLYHGGPVTRGQGLTRLKVRGEPIDQPASIMVGP